MNNLTKRLYIMSAFQSGKSFQENFNAHNNLIDHLNEQGFNPAETIGQYQGTREHSIAMQGDLNMEPMVANLAKEHNQESYLMVHPDKSSELVYSNTGKRQPLGTWTSVGKNKPTGDYTLINGSYYQVK